MKERASLIGGYLKIRSECRKGTRVCFRMPRNP